MAYKCREEIVGKRFLSVASGYGKIKGKIRDWSWRAGVIRAATHRDNTNADLQVLVEYDDVEWQRREWISVYRDNLFNLFLVEQALVWADRRDPFQQGTVLWPALTFIPLVSNVDIPCNLQPVEFLLDRELSFKDYNELKSYKEWDTALRGVKDYPEVRLAVKRWAELQDGQKILLTTPSVLVGYRVEVYRAEGTTQWYTAVIIGYNEATRDLTVTDDTVLEEHNEDPSLVQMRLIGDGVVESIMRGENVGITPRRSRSSALLHQQNSQLLQSRVIRGLTTAAAAGSVNNCHSNLSRRPRQGRSAISETGNSPEPPDKGSIPKTRKRKTSESDSSPSTRTRFGNIIKEDLENKQSRRKNNNRSVIKKKVLEEANNSKLREVEVIVEDCLQNGSYRAPPIDETNIDATDEVTCDKLETEQVQQEEKDNSNNSSNSESVVQFVERENNDVRSDVDVGSAEEEYSCESPLKSSAEVGEEEEEESDAKNIINTTSKKESERDTDCSIRVINIGDDDGPLCSSSPLSSSRMDFNETANSLRFADDRSDSGVSSLRSGSGDERSGSRSSALSSSDEPNSSTTSASVVVSTGTPKSSTAAVAVAQEPVRVWRDPGLLLQEELHVRHVHSVQHQTLLMSHPQATSTGPPQPPTSSPASATLYPQVVPPMAPHPLAPHPGHPHLPPQHLLHHAPFTDLIWKQHRYATVPSHLLGATGGQPASHNAEDLERERERAILQDRHTERMIRQQHQDREKERMEREREKQEREREREEKERQEQALQNHFEKSLRAAQQKREQQQWNPMGGRQPQSRTTSMSEEDRKQSDLHQRERHLAAVRASESNHRSYYANVPSKTSISKGEYPPPPAHSRLASSKPTEKLANMHSSMIPKTDLTMYGYHTSQNAFYEPKKADMHKATPSGLVVTKTPIDLPNPPPLINEGKTVIVKHDAKNTHHVEPRVSIALSPSPKLRNELMGHYIQASTGGSGGQKGMYEYRSPTQSPHHLNAQHRSSQMSSPHHQRQSPHPHSQQHPSPELRYREAAAAAAAAANQQMMFAGSAKANYTFLPAASTAAYTLAASTASVASKPKVSSPAPQHIYGKPNAVSVVPVTRPHDAQPHPPMHKPPLGSSISPSPYQQVSQYHPPAMTASPALNTCPPPAHISRTTSTIGYDRPPYSSISIPSSGLSVKMLTQPGTSPPTAASAPLNTSRAQHPSYNVSPGPTGIHHVQTQPLDLGVSSNKSSDNGSLSPKRKGAPTSMEVKKRRLETPSIQNKPYGIASPQLARVSEPSPLIANAATTITTLVNTYRAPPFIDSCLTENFPDLSVTAVTVEVPRPASTDSTHSIPLIKPGTPLGAPPSPALSVRNTGTPNSLPPKSTTPVLGTNSGTSTPNPFGGPMSTAGSNAGTPTPPIVDDSPGTPVKVAPITPSVVDSEKSNSPGPQKKEGGSYPVRHLKKAWLQRHTGEDLEDTTGVVGSGMCVTLPLNLETVCPAKNENPVNSIQLVGTMAVNSISKTTKHFQSKSGNRKPKEIVNGVSEATGKNDDSSSSDQERGGRKSPPKRKPPKVKRKKGNGGGVLAKKVAEEKKKKGDKLVAQSESGSDSEKESDSAKDSDSGASTSISSNGKKPGKEPRKRGRRPKSSKNEKGEEPRAKKPKEEPPRDPFRKPPVGQLKKTGETFLQDGPCFEVAPKLAKCRECRWTPNQRSRNMPNIFCRFYAFRRLRYTKNGQLAIAGFSDPHKDALEDDIKLWLPNTDIPPSDLDLDTSRFLLTQVGDHFCDLLVQEKEANEEHMSEDKVVAWKRVVQGVREMCDVCETTLFNYHWTCGKCGFVVCLDCYKSRKHGTTKSLSESGKDRDEFSWLLCTNRSSHEQEKLMLTQIIADDCLLKLGKMVHEMRELWGIEQFCGCPSCKDSKLITPECKEVVKALLAKKANGVKKDVKDEKPVVNGSVKDDKSSLNWLADFALSKTEDVVKKEAKEEGSSSEEEGNFSTLRELLIRPSHKANGSSRAASPVAKSDKKKNKSETESDTLSAFGLETTVKQEKEDPVEEKIELKHYVRRYNWQHKGRQQLPIRIMTLTESKNLYPTVPHSWLCDGKLLRLSDPTCKDNIKIFQDQWKRGQPVIVSDVCKTIDRDLWNPEAFARDFGDEKNDLINCMTGNLVPNQPMRKFWEGFEEPSKRLKDERGQPMLLKLKDWPPGEDFAEILPARFQDLMKALPCQEYTRRSGKLNLASRLPDCFVRPDLGPKMYNAYGSALHPSKGTTNLHLDVSDAVNVMVYVGVPKDGDSEEHIKEAFRAIDEAGCDILTRRRVRDKGELPGALWHIYNARDADKIRDLLNKVTVERGGRLEPHNDPIHDQSGYLDGPLRERLYKEYGVEGYAIVQCLGDAVFIPAGAPHQVRNLHNCIKVAEDFVSPENVAHCFHLTQEFRGLSDVHSNHEDKLQIKNIIYHAVKDALSTLGSIVNKRLGKRVVSLDIVPESTNEGGGCGSNGGADSV